MRVAAVASRAWRAQLSLSARTHTHTPNDESATRERRAPARAPGDESAHPPPTRAPPCLRSRIDRQQYVSWRRQGLVRPFYARKQAPKSSLWLLPTPKAPYVVKEYSGARKQVRYYLAVF